MAAVHLIVTGRVQGVGFRWFVCRAARRLGVAGWVRNLPNGSVEVAASAPGPTLAAFAADVHRGPPGARVDHLDERGLDPGEALPDPFQIK